MSETLKWKIEKDSNNSVRTALYHNDNIIASFVPVSQNSYLLTPHIGFAKDRNEDYFQAQPLAAHRRALEKIKELVSSLVLFYGDMKKLVKDDNSVFTCTEPKKYTWSYQENRSIYVGGYKIGEISRGNKRVDMESGRVFYDYTFEYEYSSILPSRPTDSISRKRNIIYIGDDNRAAYNSAIVYILAIFNEFENIFTELSQDINDFYYHDMYEKE